MDDENEQKDTFKQSFDQVKVSRQNETQKSYDSVSNSVQSRRKVFANRYETLPKVDNQTQRFYNFMKQTQDFKAQNTSSFQFQNVLSSEKLSKKSRQSNDQIQYYNYELISSRPNHQLFFRQYQTIQNEDQQGNINLYCGIKNAIYLNQQPHHQQQIFQESFSKYSYPSYISNEDNRFQNGSRFGSIYSREKRNQSKNQKIKSSFSNRPIAFKNQKLSQSNYLKSHPHYVETSQNIQGTDQIDHSPFISENEQFAIKKNRKRIGSNFNAQLNKNNSGGYVHNYEYRQDKSQNLSVNNGKDSTLAQTQIPNSMSNRSQIQKSSQIIYPSFLKGIDFSESDSPQILAQKQYQTDLFEFIKKEMIRINDENVIREQEYHKKKQYESKQQSYLKRYKQYKEVKEANKYQIQRQSKSLQQINRQIQGFEQQLKFYRQHFFSMQTSIKTKLKTQEDYYYQHKLKLQDTIMKNNQTILQYNNELKNIERQSTVKSNLSSLAFTRQQNKRLKEELRAEKELFIQRYKKLENQDNQLQRLNGLKQKQYRELILQVEKVKKSMFRMPKT